MVHFLIHSFILYSLMPIPFQAWRWVGGHRIKSVMVPTLELLPTKVGDGPLHTTPCDQWTLRPLIQAGVMVVREGFLNLEAGKGR